MTKTAALATTQAEIKTLHNMIWQLANQKQTQVIDDYMAVLWKDLNDKLLQEKELKAITKR